MSLRGLLLILGGALGPLLLVGAVHAQDSPTADTSASDTSRVAPGADTSAAPTRPDSLDRASSPEQGPPGRQTARPSNESPGRGQPGRGPGSGASDANSEAVTFSARDSMVIETTESGQDHATLHGDASMSYQEASLQAQTIEMNFQSSTLRARGAPSDTAQGSRPFFQHGGGGQGGGGPRPSGPRGGGGARPSGSQGGGGQSFTGDVLSYNLNTKRGRVVAARTERQEGFVQGGAVKLFEDSTLFVSDGTYTTCNCPPDVTPSYSLRSDEMKLKDRWVYTGSIQLYLFNIPTPLWLPFGFLPNIQGRRSGPLPPQYGEDRRGFYLKDWGWYFALNQYTDLTIRGGVWSQGSFEVRPRFRYDKRYNYSGDLRLTYRRERVGEEVDPNFRNSHEGKLRWNHSQDLSPTSSINGDVNLVTSGDFARRDSETYSDAVSQEARSSISYRKRWPNGGRQFSISARQNQQFQSGEVSMTLPDLGFSQNSFKPFRQEQRVGEERWYERITTSYQLDVRNRYNFRPRDPQDLRRNGTPADSALADSLQQADIDWYEALADRQKYELATGDDRLYDFEASHRIPLNMSFRVDRYNLTLSPNARYTSDWFINTVRRTARDTGSTGKAGEIVERIEPGFYARRDFNTSLSSSSEIYGTFPVGVGPFQGLRHRMSPSLSMNYQPNFNAPMWGRTRTLRFADGTPVVRDSETGELAARDTATGDPVRYDIVDGQRATRSTQRWSLDFSLRNVFETKRVTTDTTGRQNTERVQLLNLDVSGLSYNFAADSFRVGNSISVNARTRIDPFNVSVRSSFSPYALRRVTVGEESAFRREDRLMIAESPLTPARLTRFQFNMSADFSSDEGRGGGRGARRTGQNQRRGQQTQGRGRGSQGGDPNARSRGTPAPELSDLSIPWSLNFNFNYGLQKRQKEVTNRTATLSVNFNLNVTSRWRVRGDTGYDFIQDEMSTTRISINRNLGCWNMSFTWVPFGRFQKYGFNLQVSSGQLSQLLQLQIPNQGGQGRLGGFGDQLRGTVQGAGGLGGPGGRGGGRFRR